MTCGEHTLHTELSALRTHCTHYTLHYICTQSKLTALNVLSTSFSSIQLGAVRALSTQSKLSAVRALSTSINPTTHTLHTTHYTLHTIQCTLRTVVRSGLCFA